MTQQFNDSVRAWGETWVLIGFTHREPFEVSKHLDVRPASTACWRGYVCGYVLEVDLLVLDSLSIATDAEPRQFLGRPPEPGERGFSVSYSRLAHPVDYSGGILLGRDWISLERPRALFDPPWAYERTVEVVLEEGRVVSTRSLDEELAAIRAGARPKEYGPSPNEQGSDGARTSRDYRRFYWFEGSPIPSRDVVSARRAAERERKLEADRAAYDLYGEERVDVKCRRAGCERGAVSLSAFCRTHHFESVQGRPCPFDD